MSEEKCENCRYFNQGTGVGTGTCIRFPPVVVMDRLRGLQFYQPRVKLEDLCGEFLKKKVKE